MHKLHDIGFRSPPFTHSEEVRKREAKLRLQDVARPRICLSIRDVRGGGQSAALASDFRFQANLQPATTGAIFP